MSVIISRFGWKALSKSPQTNTIPCETVLRSKSFAYRVIPQWCVLPPDVAGCEVASVACDRNDYLYAACRVSGFELVKFDSEGNFLNFIPLEADIGRCHGLFINNKDEIWVSDDAYHVIRKFNQRGQCLQILGTLYTPSDSGVDQESSHSYLSYLTVRRMAGPFNKPTKLVEGPDGLLYASDGYGNAAVHVFSPDGTLIRSWGGPGQEPGHFNIPHSIHVDSLCRVWVSDRDNDRVQIFDREGRLLHIIDKLLYPGEVWSDRDHVYICEMEGRVSIYDMDYQLLAEIGHSKSPFYGHSFTGDSKGNLYLGSFTEYPIVKYERIN